MTPRLTLMLTEDRERRTSVVEWAEQDLPLDLLATGPTLLRCPSEHSELDQSVAFIVREMDDGALYSEALVAAALLAPVISTRDHALDALEAQPRERWGAAAERALDRLRGEEPDREVRARVRALLQRRYNGPSPAIR